MFGLKERTYSADVLISLWCDSNNKNLDFLIFRIFADRVESRYNAIVGVKKTGQRYKWTAL